MSEQNSSAEEGLPFFGNYTPFFPEVEEEDLSDHVELVALACLYSVVLFVGILGNGSLLLALMTQQAARVRSPLLLALGAADLLVCALAAPLAAAAPPPSPAPPPPCGSPLCALVVYAKCFPVAASTLSLMMISVDRYATVQHPRLLSGLQRRPLLSACLAWAGAAVCTAVPALAAALPPSRADCEGLDPRRAAVLAHVVLVYATPTALVLACHLGVRSKLCALSLTARAAHGELPLPMPLLRRPTHVIIVAGMPNNAQTQAVTYGCDDEEERRKERRESRKNRKLPSGGPVRGSSQRRPRKPEGPAEPSLLTPQPQTSTLQSRRRLANVLVSVAAVFAGCWLPHAACCVYSEFHEDAPEYLLRYSLLLGHAHSAINPVVYWALNHQTLSQQGCLPCGRGGAAQRFLFHFKFHDEQPPSSTNEAALGPFHPRYTRARPRVERCAPSSHYLY